MQEMILKLTGESFEAGAKAANDSLLAAFNKMKKDGYLVIKIDQVIELLKKSIA